MNGRSKACFWRSRKLYFWSSADAVKYLCLLSLKRHIIIIMPSRKDDVSEDPPTINPYEVLGLSEKASPDDVKSAYRKQALKHHPGMILAVISFIAITALIILCHT